MSKEKKEKQQVEGSTDLDSAGENHVENNPDQGSNADSPDNTPDEGGGDAPPDKAPRLLTIEEHRENLNVDAPVFAAVMQAQGWGAGKRIPETDFKEAVDAFLKAPMGGK